MVINSGPYFERWGVKNNTYDQIINTIKDIVKNHGMKPGFDFGPLWNFNATNSMKPSDFPFVWLEPTPTTLKNSIQGVRVWQCTFNMYALDRIDKGDNNYQQIMSDMDFLLKSIVAEIRESEFTRYNYVIIDYQDLVITPALEITDEYTNGWYLKLLLQIPDIYTPCNIPITPVVPPVEEMYVLLGYVDDGYVEGN